MNNTNLFSLNDAQKVLYRRQPDALVNYKWTRDDSYEIAQYMQGTTMRFWYNTENLNYATHWHESIEIIVPLENTYDVIIQEHIYHLNPGDILVIPPGYLHATSAPPTGSRFIFGFELDFISHLQGYSYIATLLSQPILLNNDTCSPIYAESISSIMQLARHYWGDSISKELRIYAVLLEFFSSYADYCTSQNALSVDSDCIAQTNLNTRLTVAFDYLENHFAENITLEDVANIANFSKFHFCRVFKDCTGKTFHEYLTLRRIKAAEQLLLKPGLSIMDIALQCGFSSHSTFNRTFRLCKQCTPSEFRQFHTQPLVSDATKNPFS